MSSLTVLVSTDYSGLLMSDVGSIDFVNPAGSAAVATFTSFQFGGGKISTSVAIDGSAGINQIVVNCLYKDIDASAWTFTNWVAVDRLTINGTLFGDDLTGSNRNDTINGGDGNDRLHGLAGSDQINGGAGIDSISGGNGSDAINGGTGGDILSGGNGIDTVSYARSASGVTINLGSTWQFGGDAAGDRIDGFENITGSSHDDQIQGDGNINRLVGGSGADELTGGGGADRFVYLAFSDSAGEAASDRVRDFSQPQHDLIVVSAIDALAGGADDSFTFIGKGAFDSAGQLRYFRSGLQTIIQADQNGDGMADLEIRLDGVITLTAADFIL